MMASMTELKEDILVIQECGVNMRNTIYFLLIWIAIIVVCFLYIRSDRILIEQNKQVIKQQTIIDQEEEMLEELQIQALAFINGSDEDRREEEYFKQLPRKQ